FRKIRQRLLTENKFSKYLLYAIGEIVLVVIGILIAIQINNLNQNRNEQNRIKEYAVSLIQDLESDIIMTSQIKKQNEEIVARIDSLSKYTLNRKIEDISNLTMLYFTLNKPHRPYIWNRTTITELKNSGTLGLIKNDSLSKLISEYDAFTYHLDDDFINDRIQFEKATDLSVSIVNHNYHNIYEFSEKLLPNNNERDKNFFESQEYIEAKSIDLGLITKDLDQIHEMTNSYNVLMRYLRIRTDVELPKLTNDAKEIIALLKETYLE
ncbi:MAG: hypothetical protein KAQ62_13915, partial [Cyclobacteriaceae bacterium]|nr:hypothetical protein [Cyclobacteriaceae bacterium]